MMKNKLKLSLIALVMAGTAGLSSCSKDDNNPVEPPVVETGEAKLSDSFFDKVAYKGAMGTTDWTATWTNFDPNHTVYGATTETLSGQITANRTLDASKVYLLSGNVFVNDGVTLTIPAGTVIRGDQNSKATLVISRGGKLMAEGTADKPIVFTSNKAAGERNPGDWGGIIILGKAINNNPGGTGVIEGGLNETFGTHGGTIDADNSGVLKYLRVEYPGISVAQDNEINGITFGSVGSGTTVDYVQVSYSGDDSFEWFGGSVNAKHLVSIANIDDVFDFDNGYSGRIQFAIGQRHPAFADQAGQSNGIESDNSSGQFQTTPRTRPVISNMTIVGPSAPGNSVDDKHQNANLWRRGSKMVLANSIFIASKWGIDIRDAETSAALIDGTSLIKNNIYQVNVTGKDTMVSGTAAVPVYTVDILKAYLATNGNTFITESAAGALLTLPYSLTARPTFTLATGSAAATGATF